MLTLVELYIRITMNEILLTNWDSRYMSLWRVMEHLRMPIDVTNVIYTTNEYFFLERELTITNKEEFQLAKEDNMIRHCKEYRGLWYDYVTNTEFRTLQEWVDDCGAKLEDVLYGVNRVHKNQAPQYVRLSQVLDYLGYVPEPATDTFRQILEKIEAVNGINIPPQGNKCLIQRPDGTIVIGRVIDQKYYSMDEESSICVVVPNQNNPHLPPSEYERLSDLPEGMKVYFRCTSGEFLTVQQHLEEH